MSSPTSPAKTYPTVPANVALVVADPLTLQQVAFAFSYMVDYNHRRAAREVGITAKQGLAFSLDPDIRRFIIESLSQQATRNLITESYIESHYMRLMPMLMGDVAVPMVTNSMAHKDREFNASAALTALRDMSKSTGFQKVVDKVDKSINITLNVANLIGGSGGT